MSSQALGRRHSPAAVEQHRDAIAHVVTVMRQRLTEPLTLKELAQVAYMSPFHFSRVFRLVTGTPPGRFLAALRMAEAKRLIVSSPISVTDICTSVGYSSLGTFTTQFAQQVGVGPRELRRLGGRLGEQAVTDLLTRMPHASSRNGGSVVGTVHLPWRPDLVVMIGLFPGPLAIGPPIACTGADGSGDFRIDVVPDGTYHLLAAGHPTTTTVVEVLAGDLDGQQWVGAADTAVAVRAGRTAGPVHVTLATSTGTEPPIVAGLPLFGPRLAA
jgi:AraC-like DNA-binding protein